MSERPVQIVEMPPTKIWIESDMMGVCHIFLRQEGMDDLTYSRYGYTDNIRTRVAAESLALMLGAPAPADWPCGLEIPTFTPDEIREQIAVFQKLLAEMAQP